MDNTAATHSLPPATPPTLFSFVNSDMSSDSAKENASVVDSSVIEWRNDIGNSDDPESSCYKFNENINPTRVDKGGHSHGQIGHPAGIGMGKCHNTKYFVIKSLNHQNIHLSIEKGIWATQIMNEPILQEAYHNSDSAILIFSVNMSGSFQGYAQMMTSIGRGRDNAWSEGTSKSNPWGRSFKVKWMCLNDLPFHKTLHLKNPMNDYKPVKISRDFQVFSYFSSCELLDGNNDTNGLLTNLSRDEFSLKGHYVSTLSSMPLPYSFLFLPKSTRMLAEWKPPLYDNEYKIVLVTATTHRNSPNFIPPISLHGRLRKKVGGDVKALVGSGGIAEMAMTT
ncbi:Zinc finger CCCH domain-containing protein 45 [Glycine soja]